MNELNSMAESNGRILIEKVCRLVELVETAKCKLQVESIAQGKVSQENLIMILTGQSKKHYYEKYCPIWKYRKYLLDEQTESPSSMAHANLIIKDYLSTQKRSKNNGFKTKQRRSS